jgi:hypothetical protein
MRLRALLWTGGEVSCVLLWPYTVARTSFYTSTEESGRSDWLVKYELFWGVSYHFLGWYGIGVGTFTWKKKKKKK